MRRVRKRCRCPIYAYGTLDGRFNRKNTKRTAWPDANLVAAEWENRGSWDAPNSPAIVEPLSPITYHPAPSRSSERSARFSKSVARTSAPNTLKKYRQIMRKLTAFARDRGFIFLDHFRPIHMREFRQEGVAEPVEG